MMVLYFVKFLVLLIDLVTLLPASCKAIGGGAEWWRQMTGKRKGCVERLRDKMETLKFFFLLQMYYVHTFFLRCKSKINEVDEKFKSRS